MKLLDVENDTIFGREFRFSSSSLAGEEVEIVFEDIQPCKMYSFHVTYLTEFGYGPPSQESDQFFSDNNNC